MFLVTMSCIIVEGWVYLLPKIISFTSPPLNLENTNVWMECPPPPPSTDPRPEACCVCDLQLPLPPPPPMDPRPKACCVCD